MRIGTIAGRQQIEKAVVGSDRKSTRSRDQETLGMEWNGWKEAGMRGKGYRDAANRFGGARNTHARGTKRYLFEGTYWGIGHIAIFSQIDHVHVLAGQRDVASHGEGRVGDSIDLQTHEDRWIEIDRGS